MEKPIDNKAGASDDERKKVFQKMAWGPFLNTLSGMVSMFGGPVFGTGFMATTMSIVGGAATGGAAIPLTIGLAMMAVGASMQVASMCISYMASRNYQECGLDQTDMAAHRSAACLVQELKKNGLCLTEDHHHKHGQHEHPDHVRKDGKLWQHTVPSPEAKLETHAHAVQR